MNLLDAFEASQVDIAAQVNAAAATIELPGQELTGRLATAMRVDDRGTVWLYQPAATVMLTRSQAIELMDRIAADVLRAQVRAS